MVRTKIQAQPKHTGGYSGMQHGHVRVRVHEDVITVHAALFTRVPWFGDAQFVANGHAARVFIYAQLG